MQLILHLLQYPHPEGGTFMCGRHAITAVVDATVLFLTSALVNACLVARIRENLCVCDR